MREKMRNKHIGSWIMKILVISSALFTVGILGYILVHILVRWIPYLKPSMFAWKYNSENCSMMPAIINTFEMTGISLLISVPFGVFSAIYLAEYAKKGSRVVKLVRVTTETLSGIPSIVYGLFGYLFFVTRLK